MSVLVHANALWYGLLLCYNPSGKREILPIDKNLEKIKNKKQHTTTNSQTHITVVGFSKNAVSDPAQIFR